MNERSNDERFQAKSVFSNIVWKFFERGSSVAVTLLVNIVLARLLEPSAHGLLALVSVFVTVSEIFVTAGLGNSLIQKVDADALDFSTIFWLNLVVSVIIYGILCLLAPFISAYYGYSILVGILRVLGLRIIVSAVNSVQCAHISRNMLFKNYFYSTLAGKITSGIVGIVMAYCGLGVWSLVAQSLLLTLVETIILWFRVGWRPTFEFSLGRAAMLYGFAWKVMLSSLVEMTTDQLRNLIIGKRYSPDELAFYNKGTLFPNSITTNVTSALSAVMFPVLSSRQGSMDLVLSGCRRWIRSFAYFMLPILATMAATAETLVPILLTQAWQPSVPYLQIACGIYAAWVLEVPVRESLKSVGEAGVCLRMQFAKTAISIGALVAVQSFGTLAIALSALGTSFINVFISCWCGRKYLGYRYIDVFADVIWPMLYCVAVIVSIACVSMILGESVFSLICQLTVALVTYVGLSAVRHDSELLAAKGMLVGIIRSGG